MGIPALGEDLGLAAVTTTSGNNIACSCASRSERISSCFVI
jgi:hypothetical protein